jgi:hypothetical protein
VLTRRSSQAQHKTGQATPRRLYDRLLPPQTDAATDILRVSMICDPNVAHGILANNNHANSSTDTMPPTVDLVQAVHNEPYDVSLGTPYNRTLLEEINEPWIDGSFGGIALCGTRGISLGGHALL